MLTATEIAALISTIWGNVVSLWSGVLGVGFTVISVFSTRRNLKKPMLILGLLGLFISPIFAWRDEHRARSELAKKLDEKTPKLVAKIDTSRGYEFSDGIRIFLLLSVRNVGMVPTTVHSFSLILYPPRLYQMGPFQPIYYDELRMVNPSSNLEYLFTRKDSVFERMVDPIPQGAIRRGWVAFHVKGLRYVDTHGGHLTITFKDVLDQKHSATLKMQGGLETPSPTVAFPGIEPVLPTKRPAK